MPSHQYFGPGTDVDARVMHGHLPFDTDDRVALQHDIDYYAATKMSDLDRADDRMLTSLSFSNMHDIVGQVGIRARKLAGTIHSYFPTFLTSWADRRGNMPGRASLLQIKVDNDF